MLLSFDDEIGVESWRFLEPIIAKHIGRSNQLGCIYTCTTLYTPKLTDDLDFEIQHPGGRYSVEYRSRR
jgi:hypothetical protein